MGRSRNLAILIGAAGLLLALVIALVLRPDHASASLQSAGSGVHVGVATCGGTTTVIPFAAQAKGQSLRAAVEIDATGVSEELQSSAISATIGTAPRNCH